MLFTMNRRQFLKLSAASLGSGALQMAGLSVAQQVNSASWQMQFKAALKEKPGSPFTRRQPMKHLQVVPKLPDAGLKN